jgi:hypothetical protein
MVTPEFLIANDYFGTDYDTAIPMIIRNCYF